jgi:hypothetical protein
MEEFAGVAEEPEEPVLLRHPFRCGAMLGAHAVVEFCRRVELLTAGAVQALVMPQVEVTALGALPPQALDAGPAGPPQLPVAAAGEQTPPPGQPGSVPYPAMAS